MINLTKNELFTKALIRYLDSLTKKTNYGLLVDSDKISISDIELSNDMIDHLINIIDFVILECYRTEYQFNYRKINDMIVFYNFSEVE